MVEVRYIVDFDDPALVPFRTMRNQFGHLGGGVFVAEGEKVVRRLLDSDLEVLSVVVPPKWHPVFAPLLNVRSERTQLFVGERDVLARLTGFSMFQGILGLARVPNSVGLDGLLGPQPSPLLAALDGLTSAENVGTLIRNLAAFGGRGLVVGETSSHPYLRRSVRSSMGSIFKTFYHESRDLPSTLKSLRDVGVQCLAADTGLGAPAIWDVDLRGPLCVVFGAEGDGVRPRVRDACDGIVEVPMCLDVDSINVANAAAAIFAESLRQRRLVVPPVGRLPQEESGDAGLAP
jgi:tRNA G18 (ribose-2'-O)-methylase SpoU